jgi:molybdenum ABC transporter, periplasmic molybdate-binding protein
MILLISLQSSLRETLVQTFGSRCSCPRPAQVSLSLLLKFSGLLSRFGCFLFAACLAYGAEILVASASDLAPMQQALADAFRVASGHSLRFVLGSSGMLARQIRNGAPYDVYLSANEEFVKELANSGHLLEDSVRVYGLGRVALWSRRPELRSLSKLDAESVRHISIANPAHAPYGLAARQALESQGLWKSLSPKIVYAENVRQAYEYARSGNADMTLTSWTLVFDKGGVLIPQEWHRPIRQVGGVVTRSTQREAALQFLRFLTSTPGQNILHSLGLFGAAPVGPRKSTGGKD